MACARDANGGGAVKNLLTGLVLSPQPDRLVRGFVRCELEIGPEWQALKEELRPARWRPAKRGQATLAGAGCC